MRETSRRKIEHVRVCLRKDVEGKSYFQDIRLIHNPIPDICIDDVVMKTEFLGHELSAPILIASMTGGHPATERINATLAKAAEEENIGMGVGSQRAALEDPKQEDSFKVVRRNAPTAFVYANLGIAQLKKYGIDGARRAVEMVDADAIAIHFNFLQEAISGEDPDARGCVDILKELCQELDRPVIAKEIGFGMTRDAALKLKECGVSAIDVGGCGGTNFAMVEAYRIRNAMRRDVGMKFVEWGIPTPVSIRECSVGIPIIATGGIRSGVDVARALALGASVASIGLPFLRESLKGVKAVVRMIRCLKEELRISMFSCGCRNVEEMKKAKYVIVGETAEFMRQRGLL